MNGGNAAASMEERMKLGKVLLHLKLDTNGIAVEQTANMARHSSAAPFYRTHLVPGEATVCMRGIKWHSHMQTQTNSPV